MRLRLALFQKVRMANFLPRIAPASGSWVAAKQIILLVAFSFESYQEFRGLDLQDIS
jgi:hypothetical protein